MPRYIIALTLASLSIFGCRDAAEQKAEAVATIQPIASIVEPLIGSAVHVLLSSGASPHTYDPKPSDMRTAASAAILFYGSHDLDAWATELDVPHRISLLDLVPDSMLLGGSEHHDPHFWLDPLTVRRIVPALTDSLCRQKEGECGAYRQRSQNFLAELEEVDDSVSALMESSRGASVMVSHPFIGYFARRYDLRVTGVIEEIPGSEPTPRDVMRLVEDARASGADAIFTLPQHPSRLAEAVAEATGIPIVEVDPISGGGNSYRDLLYFNARKIRDALAENQAQP